MPHPHTAPLRHHGPARWSLLAAALTVGVSAFGPTAAAADPLRVGVLAADDSDGDAAAAARSLAWAVARHANTADGWAGLRQNPKAHDILVGGRAAAGVLPRAGDGVEGEARAAALRSFMEAGGAVVLTGAVAPGHLEWLAVLDPKLELTAVAPAQKPGSARVDEAGPAPTFRTWPARLADEGAPDRAYKLKTPNEWEPAARWAGQPCALVKRFGRGFVVLSTQRHPARGLLENVAASLRLQRAGLAYRGVEHEFGGAKDTYNRKVVAPGHGETRVLVRNTSAGPVTAAAVVRLSNGRETREVRRGVADIKPGASATVAVPVMADLRGPTRVRAALVTADGAELPVAEEEVDLPAYLTVVPPAYRGMISTARRDKNVHFRVRLAPLYESVEGLPLTLTVSGPGGRVLASKSLAVQAEEFPASLDLPADAPAGEYTITAAVTRGVGREEAARAAFKIVPVRPGQVFVDQDGVLLRDGKPYFPLGIYHVSGAEVERAAELGFNMFQFWNWDATPENMDRLAKRGITAIWEGQAWGRAVVIPPATAKTDPGLQKELAAMRAAAARYKGHPGLAMWYVADEPGSYHLPSLRLMNDTWHEADEDHPTYLVATGEYAQLQTACDVLGIDVYPIYKGSRTHLSRVANATDAALKGVGHRKPVIAIPQAFGENKRHGERPAEVRCMSYLFLTHGVRGMVWYCWKETGDQTGEEGAGHHPGTQRVLKELVSEIKVFAPALMAPGGRGLRSADGRVHARLCGDDATGRFLLFVNDDDRAADTVLHLPELAGRKLTGLFGTPAAEVKGESLGLKVGPHATGVYRVE